MYQTTIFDLMYPKYKITKPIRLIETFSGYGSQALALKYLGVEFEHWKTCEWAIKSIQAYKDIHFTNDTKEISMSKDEMIDYLYNKGISSNYNEPMTKNQIFRLNEKKLKTIIENIEITHNLVNIQQVKGQDLEIIEKEQYEYILTYSFPCQDLSLAGKGKGMADTTTRSGMLWEVERILNELKELNQLPQILLMENVPQVHGSDNVEHFNKWQLALERLGYKSYFQDIIATDYGIPQTRNRCFMISILGDYSYSFPQKIPLKLKLKDLLENEVDEKYYLSDKQIKDIQSWNAYEKPLENMEKIDKTDISPTLTTRSGAYAAGMILIKNATKKGYLEATNGDGINLSNRMEYQRGNVQKDKIQTLTTSGGNDRGVCVGTYQYAKSDKFMNGKDRLKLGKNVSAILQTSPKEGVVYYNSIFDILFTIFDLCGIIDIKEVDKYERSRELLQILWKEIGKKEIWQEIRRFFNIQKKEILQSNLYENGIYENRKLQPKISSSTSNSSKHNESIAYRKEMFNMWENWKARYTSQRWELSKQQFEQFNLFMQELPYETTQDKTSMQDMWETNERFRVLQQTLFEIQKIWGSNDNKISNGLRIRKLTPRETGRLMNVKDDDIDKLLKNQSDSSAYHLFGDSICTNVLMAIFGELLDINWIEKFKETENKFIDK